MKQLTFAQEHRYPDDEDGISISLNLPPHITFCLFFSLPVPLPPFSPSPSLLLPLPPPPSSSDCMLKLYSIIIEKMPPTPSKFHYMYVLPVLQLLCLFALLPHTAPHPHSTTPTQYSTQTVTHTQETMLYRSSVFPFAPRLLPSHLPPSHPILLSLLTSP